MADPRTVATLAKVIRDEGMHVSSFSDSLEAQELTARDLPALAILEHDPPGIDGMSICRAIRAHESDHKYQLPVVMVSAQEGQVTGTAAGVTGLAGQTVQRRLCPDQDPRMGIPHHVSVDARGHSGRRGASPGIASRKFDRITRLASPLPSPNSEGPTSLLRSYATSQARKSLRELPQAATTVAGRQVTHRFIRRIERAREMLGANAGTISS